MRRWLLTGACLALLGGFAWVAAPALSLRPFMPGGVDFERGIPKVKRISGTDSFDPEFAPPRKGEVQHIALDTTRAREELSWQAQVGLDDGLERTLASLR